MTRRRSHLPWLGGDYLIWSSMNMRSGPGAGSDLRGFWQTSPLWLRSAFWESEANGPEGYTVVRVYPGGQGLGGLAAAPLGTASAPPTATAAMHNFLMLIPFRSRSKPMPRAVALR